MNDYLTTKVIIMARSIKGSKAGGYEYWSRRPNNKGATGKASKKIIHGIERAQSRALVREEIYNLYS